MGRCDYTKLKNIEPVLNEIRKWKGIKEPKPGIFYLKSQGFMHFHEKDGKIWADARDGKDWGKPIDIPSSVSKAFIAAFLKEISRRYEVSL